MAQPSTMQTETDQQQERWPMWSKIDEQDVLVTEDEVIVGVSAVLEHFCARSDKLQSIAPTAFDGYPLLADRSVHAFLHHILRNGLCSKECFIMSLVYCERILQRGPDFVISRRNVHRFVLASVLVGSKIVDDFYCRNVYYAMASGITKAELNALELKLCFLLDFEMNVKPEEFALYRDSLIRGKGNAQRTPVQPSFAVQQPQAVVTKSSGSVVMHTAGPPGVTHVTIAPPPQQASRHQALPVEFGKPEYAQWPTPNMPTQAMASHGRVSQVKERKQCSMLPVARMPLPQPQQPVIPLQITTVMMPPPQPQPEKHWAVAGPLAYTCPWKHTLPYTAPKYAEQEPTSMMGNHDPLGAASAWFGYSSAAPMLPMAVTPTPNYPMAVPQPYSCQSHTFPVTPIAWLAAQPV